MKTVNWPAVEPAVLECLAEHYDLAGRLERLPGENLNYLVTLKDERKFVCKIVEQGNPSIAAEVEQAVFEAARAGGFSVKLPYIRKTNTQNYETGIKMPINGTWLLRLMDYVPGKSLEKRTDISIKLLKNTGKTVARFDRALAGFDHPGLHRTHRWSLAEAGRHRRHLPLIGNAIDRALVEWAFARWEEVAGMLTDLPRQVIHGDANPENILVEGDEITGLVDLGDCLFTARVCELAICMAYLMMDRDDPLAAGDAVIEGYASVIDLASRERRVLLPLVCGRLAVTVCMATYRQTLDPANANWFVSLAPALRLLEQLRENA